MAIGLPEVTGPEHSRIDRMLLNPLLEASPVAEECAAQAMALGHENTG